MNNGVVTCGVCSGRPMSAFGEEWTGIVRCPGCGARAYRTPPPAGVPDGQGTCHCDGPPHQWTRGWCPEGEAR